MASRTGRLGGAVLVALFLTSYSPLFLILAVNQLIDNADHLRWGGLGGEAVLTFLQRFGLASLCLVLIGLGYAVLRHSLRQMTQRVDRNGRPVLVVDTENKNSEAIGYIGTYIIPFLFQDYGSPANLLSLLILLVVISTVYVNSSLVVVNPVLQWFGYSLFETTFKSEAQPEGPEDQRKGMVLVKTRELAAGDRLLIKAVGHKLHYAVPPNAVTA